MPYATQAQLEQVWGEGFVTGILPEDVEPADAVASALQSASDEIDVYLSVRYPLPLEAAPASLVTPAANIAVYILANRHTALTETIEERYKQTIKMLERIADGKAGLGQDEPKVSTGEDGSAGGAAFSANDRIFSRRTLP
jgi:phage gp36-like protein